MRSSSSFSGSSEIRATRGPVVGSRERGGERGGEGDRDGGGRNRKSEIDIGRLNTYW